MSKQELARAEKMEPATTETTAIVEMIDRAARDNTVDINKMRELLAMRKEIVAEIAEREFNDAMNEAQKEMRPVAADASNPSTKSKYASFLALDRSMRPIYSKHGLSLSFNTAEGAPEGSVRVVCDVSRGGYKRRYQIDMPADGKGAKGGDVMTKTHAMGAAMTYGQRYLLKMIFNVAVGDDDDGNYAASKETISQEQAEHLNAACDEIGADKRAFCEYFNIEGVALLPANKYDTAIRMLEQKRAKAAKVKA